MTAKKLPDYDAMDPQSRFIALFEATETARKKAGGGAKGHEAAKAVWNAWAEPLMAEREALKESGQWQVSKVWDHELAMIAETGDNKTTRTFLTRANLSAQGVAFVAPEKLPDKSDGPEEIDLDLDGAVKTIKCEMINFAGFVFPGFTNFWQARFGGEANFRKARFGGEANFWQARFGGEANFWQVRFGGDAYFEQARFGGYAYFERTRFSRAAIFKIAEFSSTANFSLAKFESSADFTAIDSKRNFDLSGAEFHYQVPRFIQAHFSESPRLDHVTLPMPEWGAKTLPPPPPDEPCKEGWRLVELQRGFPATQLQEKLEPLKKSEPVDTAPESETWTEIEMSGQRFRQRQRRYQTPKRKPGKQIDQDDIAAYTALRRMASQAHDHETEHMAFKGEMRARRALAGPSSSFFGMFSGFYDALTDFGWSFLRPLFVWALLLVGIARFYFSAHHSGYGAHSPPDFCQSESRIKSALLLSANNALLFATTGQRPYVTRARLCLYGKKIGDQKIVHLPPGVGLLGGVHTLLSAIFIFFTLLALRNRFRIR